MKISTSAIRKKFPAILLLLNLQYFIVTIIVAVAWNPSFNWKDNYTSSLGNTACGISEGIYVCSPLHAVMNASFIMQGIVLIVAGILLARQYIKYKAAAVGFALLPIAGIGAVILGCFPENVDLYAHNTGAITTFVFAILSLFLISSSKLLPNVLRLTVLVLAVISSIALVLFDSEIYLGLGLGGMERFMDYTQAIALIVVAIALLKRR